MWSEMTCADVGHFHYEVNLNLHGMSVTGMAKIRGMLKEYHGKPKTCAIVCPYVRDC